VDRLDVSKRQQTGCYASLLLVAVGVALYLGVKRFPQLELFWRVTLGAGALLGALVFLSLGLKAFRLSKAAFEAQLAKFPADANQFYKTDQGWLAVSPTGVGTSYRPLTTCWSDFSQIRGLACGYGRTVHNAWWKSKPEDLPRVEQIEEPWLLIISDDATGPYQFVTCPPKLEPKIWFRILKSRVEQKEIREFPKTKIRPNYMRHGGGFGELIGGMTALLFCGLILAVALPGGISDRYLVGILVFPNLFDWFSWIKRKPDVKPEAIARHFAALNGCEAPLVAHQVFGPASGKLFIGSETNLLDILEIEKLSSVELVTSKSSVVSRDIKNLKEPGPPITKLKLTYPRDHDSEYTLVLPTDHAQRLYNSLLAERPDLKIFGSTDLIPQPT
jgi:hypothetical protein